MLVDSTPVVCARSVETIRRSQLADAADYGYCVSHSRCFGGFRLHGLFALDGTPRALLLTSPKAPERDVSLTVVERCQRSGHLYVLGDKGYAGREPERAAAEPDAKRPPSAPASAHASSHSPPQSASTTASTAHHARSSTTQPEFAQLLI